MTGLGALVWPPLPSLWRPEEQVTVDLLERVVAGLCLFEKMAQGGAIDG